MEVLVKQPLFNLQLELLKAFSHQLTDDEIRDLKKLLVQFFSRRAIDQANKTWDEKGWTDADIDRMLATKLRASKASNK